jgi:hypothetical protein
MASTRLPMLATLVACALGCAAHLHLLPATPIGDAQRAAVQHVRAELAGRWRCDVATRRALLSDGDDAEQLYADVETSCPAAADPAVAGVAQAAGSGKRRPKRATRPGMLSGSISSS